MDSRSISLRWGFALTAALIVAMATSATATAAPILELSINGTTWETVALIDQGGGTYEFDAANLSGLMINGAQSNYEEINVTITTNSPGTAALAELITVETSARMGGAGGGNRDLYIRVTDEDFTAPLGSDLLLRSSFSGVVGDGLAAPSLTSSVFDPSDPSPVLAGAGPHALGTTMTASFANTLVSPFALRNVTYINLNPNAEANTVSSTRIEAVPEPATLAAWSLFACLGGLAASRRKRLA
jgi:hypothetical protein